MADGDEELDSLISGFDQICKEFSDSVSKIQQLESICNSEIQKRQALQFTSDLLKSENERLMKLYTGSINKLADQLECQTSWQVLKEQLKRACDEHTRKENELRNEINVLKQDYNNKIIESDTMIRDLLLQKATNESTISELQQDLTMHRNHIEALTSRLNRVHADVESTCELIPFNSIEVSDSTMLIICYTDRCEIQDLKDCLMMEQEEKNALNKKLQSLEKELLISRTKLVENQQDLTSNRQVDTLKQKVMRLRKENEILKRQLLDSQEG